MSSTTTFNDRVTTFGREIFAELVDHEPSPLEPRYFNDLLLKWSMRLPEFKVNLFRLVDVLPTLKSDQAIAEHVREYLIPPAERLHPALAWLVGLSQKPVLDQISAYLVKKGVKQMANMFIAGESPLSAVPTLRRLRSERFAFTVDLLGEFCVSEPEALNYQQRYFDAIDTIADTLSNTKESHPLIPGHPGEVSPVCVSIKLTALYSQTNILNFDRSVAILSERLAEVVRRVKKRGASIYVDAEDTGNNAIIYAAFQRVFSSQEFCDFPFPGIVIQVYAKQAGYWVDQMLALARSRGAPITIRLVKGAYWDFERTVCNQNDWEFPLWERKESTDAYYEHLSKVLLDNHQICLPAFGSHNIRSLSHACCYAESIGLTNKDFELQVLYGMAKPIAEAFLRRNYLERMYVPLGNMLSGMGHLVRRLIENTSNESFLRHTFFEEDDIATLLKEPKWSQESYESAQTL